MKLNERLKYLRKQAKFSQRMAAIGIGIVERHYQDLEYGTKSPSIETLNSIAKFYKIPIDYLFGNGIFQQWDSLMERKDEILDAVSKRFNEDFGETKWLTSFQYEVLSNLPENELMYRLNFLLQDLILKDDRLQLVYRA